MLHANNELLLLSCFPTSVCLKTRSHDGTLTVTAIDSSNRLHWSEWRCSHCSTVTTTWSQKVFHSYRWKCSNWGQLFRCSFRTVWMVSFSSRFDCQLSWVSVKYSRRFKHQVGHFKDVLIASLQHYFHNFHIALVVLFVCFLTNELPFTTLQTRKSICGNFQPLQHGMSSPCISTKMWIGSILWQNLWALILLFWCYLLLVLKTLFKRTRWITFSKFPWKSSVANLRYCIERNSAWR